MSNFKPRFAYLPRSAWGTVGALALSTVALNGCNGNDDNGGPAFPTPSPSATTKPTTNPSPTTRPTATTQPTATATPTVAPTTAPGTVSGAD